jgi:type IX secretion system PorP/SprF family membrane protein
MKLKPTILFLIVSICISISYDTVAQDYIFSQVFSNPLLINPAYAGSLGRSRVSSSYRNQFKGELVTFGASYDQYIQKLSGGVGLQYISEKYYDGLYQKKILSGIYAYNLGIGENMHLRPAVNIGLGLAQIDWSHAVPIDPFDPLLVDDDNYYFNAGAGILFTWKNLVSGISVDHINKPHAFPYSDNRLSSKLTVHVNYLVEIKEHFSLTPGIIFQHQDNSYYFLPSLMAKIWFLKVGIASSSQIDDPGYLTGMIGFENKWLSLGYSYDNWNVYNLPISDPQRGIHEFTAAFNFSFTKNKDENRVAPFGGF